MNHHGKVYSNGAEHDNRYEIFKKNYQMITDHNLSGQSWTLAVNQFADMSWEEFRHKRLGYNRNARRMLGRGREPVITNMKGLFTVPDEMDWVSKGVVSQVKNQESCGSCWAFSTTGSVEAAYAIKTGTLYSLSEQQLIDCAKNGGDDGCEGGLLDPTFEYVIGNHGICQEDEYKYLAQDGSTCKSSKCKAVAPIVNYTDVAVNDEDALQAACAQQPVSIAIEADQWGFQFYSSGVFDGSCGTQLDHAVLLVGYGTDADTAKHYWKVKNSWGGSWGEKGYIRMLRTPGGKTEGQCGIAMAATYPIA